MDSMNSDSKLNALRRWGDYEPLLADWRERVGVLQNVHTLSSKYMETLHTRFGVVVTATSAVVGGGALISFNNSEDGRSNFLVGMLVLLAPAIAGIHTFLRYTERSEKHRIGGARLGALERKIDQKRELNFEERGAPEPFMDKVREEWDAIILDLPTIPDKIYYEHEEEILGKKKGEEVLRLRDKKERRLASKAAAKDRLAPGPKPPQSDEN
jgi:hypothetical protein